jgi:hypothetical protein
MQLAVNKMYEIRWHTENKVPVRVMKACAGGEV